MRHLLIRLYPARWRARYEDEFVSLLEERPLGPSDVADVVHGAVDAHLRLRGRPSLREPGGRSAMTTRIWGPAAIVGGLLWSAGMFGAMFDASGRPWAMTTAFAGSSPMMPFTGSPFLITGTALLLVALVGLGSFQGRRHPRLIWASVLLPAIGAAISLFGLLGLPGIERVRYTVDFEADAIWDAGLVAMLVGSALFALATWRARLVSRTAAGVLLIGSSVMVAMWVGGTWIVTRDFMKASWYLGFFYLALFAFAAGWIGLGWSAIRSARPDVAPDAAPAS